MGRGLTNDKTNQVFTSCAYRRCVKTYVYNKLIYDLHACKTQNNVFIIDGDICM